MDLASRLTRLEIAFEDGNVTGAQATIEDGLTEDGTWTRLRERTVGLDAGGNPEYAASLADALGEATALALAANSALTEENAALIAERDELAERLAATD